MTPEDKALAEVIAARINARRRVIHMSIKEIAEACGVSYSSLYHLSSAGAIPTTKLLIKIANVLKTSPDYLLGATESMDAVKHAHWMRGTHALYCSACYHISAKIILGTDYCGYCGARMDEPADELTLKAENKTEQSAWPR